MDENFSYARGRGHISQARLYAPRHGACGYRALKEQLHDDETGIFLETAHPAKFKDTVDRILGIDLPIPEKLQAFMRGQKQSIPLSSDFADFKAYLMAQ